MTTELVYGLEIIWISMREPEFKSFHTKCVWNEYAVNLFVIC